MQTMVQPICLALSLLLTWSIVVSANKNAFDDYKEDAKAALVHLKATSASGIFNTLHLESILDASVHEGTFHNNVMLALDLSSPWLKSTNHRTTVQMMVMKPKYTADAKKSVPSYAIDEFPVFDEAAIARFQNETVESRIQRRQQLFQKWNNEYQQNLQRRQQQQSNDKDEL